MIWRDDDKRDEQQKKLEYARELEQQIEQRKALEREEKQQQEDWERRFVLPRDAQSPAKWWTEFRASEPPATRLGFQMDESALPYANPAEESSVPTPGSVTVSNLRFHATLGDPLASVDRLREKAQQLEWRRLLEMQMHENAMRKQQEAEEKRRREMEEAQEEVRFLRDQQRRAQRKLGIQDYIPTAAYSPQNYVSIPSPSAPSRLQDETAHDEHYVHPPPAPVQARVGDSVDFDFRRAMGLTDAPQPVHEVARDSVADEYRALLMEIRREREELRRERDELRREKEELRMERALLQMENEKMATLLESQRHMTEQRLENIARLDRAFVARDSPSKEDPPVSQYSRQQPPKRLPSPLHIVHRDHNVQQLRTSMASMAIGSRPQQPSPVHFRRDSRLGAMSMADFAPTTNLRSSPSRAIDTVHARRNERFRLREHENPLERSLLGESEFIALSPPTADIRRYGTAPRITETRSPAASRVDQQHANPLRNSRVIKSRGFYDFNREDAQPPRAQEHTQRTSLPIRGSFRATATSEDSDSDDKDDESQCRVDQQSDYSGEHNHESDDDHQDDEYPDGDDNVLNTSHSDSEFNRSLFQVQVLVNE